MLADDADDAIYGLSGLKFSYCLFIIFKLLNYSFC